MSAIFMKISSYMFFCLKKTKIMILSTRFAIYLLFAYYSPYTYYGNVNEPSL